jgi:hypothetical protein
MLVVFVDALGARQSERLAQRSMGLAHRTSLRGVLGYSSGALPTVLTGVDPSVHGRMCLFSRAETDTSLLAPLSWLGLLPRLVHERPRLRGMLSSWLRQSRNLRGYVQLGRVPPSAFRWLDMPERDDLFQTETIGGARTFLADAREAGLSVFSARWQLDETARWQDALSRLAQEPPDLAFLYATELDGLLHRVGNEAGEVDAVLDRLAARIVRARELMGRGGAEVRTLVVGDHGMADVREIFDPRPLLGQLGARHFVDSTMLRLWGDGPTLDRAHRLLASRFPGRWLDADALAERRAPAFGGRYGDALWLLPEGHLFAPSFMGGAVRGMHGYDLDAPSAQAGLLTDAADVAREVKSLTGIAGVVREHFALV